MKNKLLTYSITVLLGIAGFSANAQKSWLITGNSNTGQNNCIGTKNVNPLIFRPIMLSACVYKNGQLGYGITAPIYALQIQNPAFSRGVSVSIILAAARIV